MLFRFLEWSTDRMEERSELVRRGEKEKGGTIFLRE
jgi:hypothetical protein